MPVINITMTREDGGATKEQKELLAKGVTELFEKVFKRSGKNAVLIINEISTDDYAIGGETVSNIRKK